MPMSESRVLSRRYALALLLGAGPGAVGFGRALSAFAAEGKVTETMIRKAEWVSGLSFTDADRKLMLQGVQEAIADYEKIRAVKLDNATAPAYRFDPESVLPLEARRPAWTDCKAIVGPDWPVPKSTPAGSDLAFASVATLSSLLKARKISSVELTRFYLDRLKQFDRQLLCTVTYLSDRALPAAEAADREIAAGQWRGPLHGIPWGVKDLLAVGGHPTTWGATPYKDQMRAETAAVVEKLDAAGAVLIAKLSVGALAWGDVWFGGMTRNPWNVEQGSSGSSAGSSSATSAGLTAFAIGTETWGSIVSPCSRCGVTGLRPTFGRVSRHGAMALSWTMDKIGPIARTAEDCALVFSAIHGADPRDPTTVDRAFAWPQVSDPKRLRVAFAAKLFEEDRAKDATTEEDKRTAREEQENDQRTLSTLRAIGFDLRPIDLDSAYPVNALGLILGAEAAAAFDELTRSGKDDLLERQVADAWPNVFRQCQLIPAVEYVRANRIRSLVQAELERQLADVDVWITPSFGGDVLLRTNLTGHPCVVLPNGSRSKDGTPTSITFLGRLHREAEVLAVAHAYQQVTDYHQRRPPGEWSA